MNTRKHVIAKSALFSATLLLLLLVQARGNAFQLHRTEDGRKIRWHKFKVHIVLDSSLASIGPQQEVEHVIIAAFEEWIDQAALPIDFRFTQGECGEPGYHSNEKNRNCVMARDDMKAFKEHGLATTLLSYSPMTGKITDADIVFDSDAGIWSEDGAQNTLDLQRVALHEVGHLLGLSHSHFAEARMFRTLRANEAERNVLHSDDVDGAAALYDDLEAELDLKCSTSGAAISGPPSGWFFIVLMTVIILLRRGRKTLRTKSHTLTRDI